MTLQYDMTGKRIGKWTVLGRHLASGYRAMWTCQCVCGTIRPVNGVSLRSGISLSCGCFELKREKREAPVRKCSDCGKTKKAAEFNGVGVFAGNRCRTCKNAWLIEWRRLHPEYEKARNQRRTKTAREARNA